MAVSFALKDGFLSSIDSELEHSLESVPNWSIDSSLLKPGKPVADDTTKLLVRDGSGVPYAVLVFSDETRGNLPVRGAAMSEKIRSASYGSVASSILSPLSYGNIRGVSYALWPYRRPLTDLPLLRNFQRFVISRKAFTWLLQLTNQTKSIVSPALVEQRFIDPMRRLAADRSVSEKVRADLLFYASRAEEGSWRPMHVAEHGDLWLGNMLVCRESDYSIAVIDWAGAKLEGHAMYDLSRLSRSLNVSTGFYRSQVRLHCAELNCEFGDSLGYLLSSLARLSENLEHFPHSRFIQLLESTHRFHCESLGI